MKLSDRQSNFTTDLCLFLAWLKIEGYKVTLGEGWRTQDQQDIYYKNGYTRVKYSKHQDRLAQDLNFFIENVSMWEMTEETSKQIFKRVGDKWESLRLGNRWGGNFYGFYDPGHIEAA